MLRLSAGVLIGFGLVALAITAGLWIFSLLGNKPGKVGDADVHHVPKGAEGGLPLSEYKLPLACVGLALSLLESYLLLEELFLKAIRENRARSCSDGGGNGPDDDAGDDLCHAGATHCPKAPRKPEPEPVPA